MTQHAVVGGRWRDFHSKFVVEERYLPRATRARLYFVSATMVAVGLTAFIVLLLGALTHSGFELMNPLDSGSTHSETPARPDS